MALVLSFCEKYRAFNHTLVYCVRLSLILLWLLVSLNSRATVTSSKTYSSYPHLQHTILNNFAKAQKRIFIASQFIADTEISTALYLAKYRKLEIKVFLIRQSDRNWNSSLAFLKQHEIPFTLMDKMKIAPQSTLILCDDKLMTIHGHLDYTSPRKRIHAHISQLKKDSPSPQRLFAQMLTKKHEPSNPRPRFSTYNYDRRKTTDDREKQKISRKLPKKTIWQKQQQHP